MSILNDLIGTFNSAVESVTETYNIVSTSSSNKTIQVNGQTIWITKLLSEGGFSQVYLAENQQKELFAVKAIRCRLDKEAAKAAIREALITDRFQQKGIIQIIDVCMVKEQDSNRTLYMLMPFYKRGNLQDMIERNFIAGTHISEKELLLLFEQICTSVQVLANYTNKRGERMPYAHRDIKPANVLLSDDGTMPVLMDFGSAKPARIYIENKKSAIVEQDDAAEHCSMPYRAPELFDVKPDSLLTEKVDIWSLGCTLFAVAYGVSPFEMTMNQQGGTLPLAILNRQFSFPSNQQHYSKGFQNFISWLLTTDPDRRPSIDHVLLALDKLMNRTSF
ncbi:serine/threonine protein kinase [Choanephora cucurbitarum]|nr:serine/threonine protein kinase [Choanephora cucurbitarum]